MWSVFLWKTIHVFCNHTFCDVKYFYFLLSKYSLISGKGPLGGSRWKLLELTSVSRFLAYCKGISTHNTPQVPYFDKSSAMISTLVNKTWFSRYPRCQQVIYDNGGEFKLHFEALCDTYGIKRKPTSVKNPQANAILEQVHQVIMTMLHTAEIDMAISSTQWHCHVPNQRGMGHSLYLP